MAGRRIRDERDARGCLAAIDASGMERADWARAHGVEPRSLNAWRINLARGDVREPVGGGLLELVAAGKPSRAAYTVRCGAFAVDVDPEFDAHVLGRLLAVVAGC